MKVWEGESSYQRSYRRNLCTVIKSDMNQLFHRVKDRYEDYMGVFSKRRTREHFKEIFQSRYLTIPLNDMAILDQDMLVSIDAFYFHVAELNWYLFCTEEMPATVMENVLAQIRTLERLHETADALLEASLQVVKEDLKATQEFVQEHASREYTPDFQGSSFDDNLVGTLGMDLPELDSNDDFKKKT